MLSACVQAEEGRIPFAAWVRFLPEVPPFFVGMAHTIDRTVARLECRLRSLQAEAARLAAALDAGCSQTEQQTYQTKRAAVLEAMADYQASLAQCRSQFEAQVARRWTAAEIARAKCRANDSLSEPVRAA